MKVILFWNKLNTVKIMFVSVKGKGKSFTVFFKTQNVNFFIKFWYIFHLKWDTILQRSSPNELFGTYFELIMINSNEISTEQKKVYAN